jgi:hypothetical protein
MAAAAIILATGSSAQASGQAVAASRQVDEAIESAADALKDATAENSEGTETLTETDVGSGGLWKPITYFDPLIDDFNADAERAGRVNAAARKAVAAKYGLSVVALEETISLLRQMALDEYNDKKKAALRSQALRLVESSRAPIALMIASGVVDQVGDHCTPADVDMLMKRSSNPEADLWAIATGCSSSGAFAVALDRSPRARPALSYIAMNWTDADPASNLAAADALLRADFLAQVEVDQRDRVHADIARYKLSKLLDLGMLNEALAFGDSLTPPVRMQALRPGGDEVRATIGGFRLKTSPYGQAVAADYAAALALAGRQSEARSVLDLVAPAATRRAARVCLDAGKPECTVEGEHGVPLDTLVVDQLLDSPDADPYVLVETQAMGLPSRSGGVTEAFCKIAPRPDEQGECKGARAYIARNRAEKGDEQQDAQEVSRVIRRLGGQPFEAARAGYAARLATLGFGDTPLRDWSRASVDPAPIPFRERPLPAAARASKPREGASPRHFAPLPGGFTLVRAERSGQRAAAISLSQRFDPDGEVSAGGYWLHLSEDGGKSWQPPLYTGLAEHFPYVIPTESRVRMLAGDRIKLEVKEELIDTASISYPPVGTRIRRKRQGIYLDIPIAELRKDSDGDGLSDIAARHLLLDQQRDGGTPFVVGQDRKCSAPSADTEARLEILKKIFQVEARAIIEPVGPRKELIGPWRRSTPSEKPPIFLLGNPGDYRCLTLDRPMIVYSEADRERLREHSPDFQLIELPPIHWNRGHTRGFVNWSMGWAGGTYRLMRNGHDWKLESISEWVT